MGEIKLAKIRFSEEKEVYIVSIETIREKIPNKDKVFRNFLPEHAEDYNQRQWYYVKWKCEDPKCYKRTKEKHFHWWPAVILGLGENQEDLERRCGKQRLRYPNLKSASSMTDSEPENNTSTIRQNVTSLTRKLNGNSIRKVNSDMNTSILLKHKQNLVMSQRSLVSNSDDEIEETEKKSLQGNTKSNVNDSTSITPHMFGINKSSCSNTGKNSNNKDSKIGTELDSDSHAKSSPKHLSDKNLEDNESDASSKHSSKGDESDDHAKSSPKHPNNEDSKMDGELDVGAHTNSSQKRLSPNIKNTSNKKVSKIAVHGAARTRSIPIPNEEASGSYLNPRLQLDNELFQMDNDFGMDIADAKSQFNDEDAGNNNNNIIGQLNGGDAGNNNSNMMGRLNDGNAANNINNVTGQFNNRSNANRVAINPQAGLLRSIKKKYEPKTQKFNLNIEAKRFALNNGMIYLGLDIWVDEEIWYTLQLQDQPMIYLRDLADMVWTPEKLVNRCLKLNSIRVTNINPKCPTSPRKELESDRMQLLCELFEEYLKKKRKSPQEKQFFMSKIRLTLKQKIQDLRSHYKRNGTSRI